MTWKFIVNCGDSIRSIPDVWIDFGLYVGMALTSFWAIYFSTDQAEKFINPQTLFWLLALVGSMDAFFLGAKLYRSTGFAAHKDKLQTDETTRLLKSQMETKTETKP